MSNVVYFLGCHTQVEKNVVKCERQSETLQLSERVQRTDFESNSLFCFFFRLIVIRAGLYPLWRGLIFSAASMYRQHGGICVNAILTNEDRFVDAMAKVMEIEWMSLKCDISWERI